MCVKITPCPPLPHSKDQAEMDPADMEDVEEVEEEETVEDGSSKGRCFMSHVCVDLCKCRGFSWEGFPLHPPRAAGTW